MTFYLIEDFTTLLHAVCDSWEEVLEIVQRGVSGEQALQVRLYNRQTQEFRWPSKARSLELILMQLDRDNIMILPMVEAGAAGPVTFESLQAMCVEA